MDVSVAAGAAVSLPKLAGRDRPLDSPCNNPHTEVTLSFSKKKPPPSQYLHEDMQMPKLRFWPLKVQSAA